MSSNPRSGELVDSPRLLSSKAARVQRTLSPRMLQEADTVDSALTRQTVLSDGGLQIMNSPFAGTGAQTLSDVLCMPATASTDAPTQLASALDAYEKYLTGRRTSVAPDTASFTTAATDLAATVNEQITKDMQNWHQLKQHRLKLMFAKMKLDLENALEQPALQARLEKLDRTIAADELRAIRAQFKAHADTWVSAATALRRQVVVHVCQHIEHLKPFLIAPEMYTSMSIEKVDISALQSLQKATDAFSGAMDSLPAVIQLQRLCLETIEPALVTCGSNFRRCITSMQQWLYCCNLSIDDINTVLADATASPDSADSSAKSLVHLLFAQNDLERILAAANKFFLLVLAVGDIAVRSLDLLFVTLQASVEGLHAGDHEGNREDAANMARGLGTTFGQLNQQKRRSGSKEMARLRAIRESPQQPCVLSEQAAQLLLPSANACFTCTCPSCKTMAQTISDRMGEVEALKAGTCIPLTQIPLTLRSVAGPICATANVAHEINTSLLQSHLDSIIRFHQSTCPPKELSDVVILLLLTLGAPVQELAEVRSPLAMELLEASALSDIMNPWAGTSSVPEIEAVLTSVRSFHSAVFTTACETFSADKGALSSAANEAGMKWSSVSAAITPQRICRLIRQFPYLPKHYDAGIAAAFEALRNGACPHSPRNMQHRIQATPLECVAQFASFVPEESHTNITFASPALGAALAWCLYAGAARDRAMSLLRELELYAFKRVIHEAIITHSSCGHEVAPVVDVPASAKRTMASPSSALSSSSNRRRSVSPRTLDSTMSMGAAAHVPRVPTNSTMSAGSTQAYMLKIQVEMDAQKKVFTANMASLHHQFYRLDDQARLPHLKVPPFSTLLPGAFSLPVGAAAEEQVVPEESAEPVLKPVWSSTALQIAQAAHEKALKQLALISTAQLAKVPAGPPTLPEASPILPTQSPPLHGVGMDENFTKEQFDFTL
jgi:hypothetical protein